MYNNQGVVPILTYKFTPLMGKIEHTNLIIDDFSIARKDSQRVYTHILTHIHTDHIKGLSDSWNFGPIYCSKITGQLLLQRFPSLTCIQVLNLQTPTKLKMSSSLELTVTLFDANHCFGAVMVLIEGYMGTILYSGDIRFDREVFKNYHLLYPPDLRDEQFKSCSKKIDLLYVDNTFLKKKFSFPKKQQVMEQTLAYIQSLMALNQHSRIFVGLDIYGKQQVVQYIAKELDIYIVVDAARYEILKAMDRDIELYTTNLHQGFIQVVSKRRLKEYLDKQPHGIGIVLSGWANKAHYRFNNRIYCLPYSLHSNYQEIHDFVASICPTKIEPIVFTFPQEDRIYYAEKQNKNLFNLGDEDYESGKNNYNYELDQLRRLYCTPPSEQYKKLMNDPQVQKAIAQKLMPQKIFDFAENQKQMMPIGFQTVQRKKYKLKNERNQSQINRLRNQILLKKKIIDGQRMQIIDDQFNDSIFKIKQIVIEQQDSHKKQAINIEDNLQINDQPQVVQIDFFNEPLKSSRSKRKTFLETSNSPSLSKEAEERFLDKIRKRLKEKQKIEQNRSSGSKQNANFNVMEISESPKSKENSSSNQKRERSRQIRRGNFETSKAYFDNMIKDVNNRKSSNEKMKQSRAKRTITPEDGLMGSINFDDLKKIKIVKGKDALRQFFKKNSAGKKFITNFFSSQASFNL